MIVIHYTAMSSAGAALERLCNPEAEVSAHYLIEPDGSVIQLVKEEARAWHAGAGSWGGTDDVNSASIGVEIANPGDAPFGEPVMSALEGLIGGCMSRWNIPPERVIGHSDMAPTRKGDPGPRFDWRRLALRGLAVWPGMMPDGVPARADAHEFLARARGFGFTNGEFPAVHKAFRLRFRPWADGGLDGWDMAVIADLAARYPVDAGPYPA